MSHESLSMSRAGEDVSRGSRRPDWMTQLVLPVLVAVLGTLLVTALTPLGELVREIPFPTRAAVSGSAVVDGRPAPAARLDLDGKDEGETDSDGRFLLSSVSNGEHRLKLQMIGAKTREWEFTVDRGETKLNLGSIDLQPLVRLGYTATVTPPRFGNRRSASSLNADVGYDLTLWIRGDAAATGRIKSVSYTLPAPLPSVPVNGSTAGQAFCYRQAGTLPFDDLLVVGGAFTNPAAVVSLGDGEPFQIAAQPGDARPPNCPVTQAGRSRGAAERLPGEPGQVPVPQPAPAPVPVPGPIPGPGPGPMAKVTVPDVVGATTEEAERRLRAKGFAVRVKIRADAAVEPGIVLDQTPDGGKKAAKGSPVTIVVASVTVPDVVGANAKDAREKLESNHFIVEERIVDDSAVKPGTVVDQMPHGGDQAAKGSTVRISVAR